MLLVKFLHVACSPYLRCDPFRRTSPSPPPLPLLTQLREAASESELYTFVMKSYKMVQQAVYWVAYRARAVAGEHIADVDADNEGEQADPRLFGASSEVLDTMTRRLKECSYQFGRLEEAVER